MNVNQFNILHSGVVQELSELRDSAKEERSSSGKYLYDDGSIVIPIAQQLELDVFKDEHNDSSSDSFREYRTMFSNARYFHGEVARGHSTLQGFKSIDIKMLISVIDELAKEEGMFYGVMIADGHRRYNILHPIVAMMIAGGEIQLSDTVEAVLFQYKTKRDISKESAELYIEKIEQFIGFAMNKKEKPIHSLEPRRSISDDVRNFVENGDALVSFRESSSNVRDILIPVQFATEVLTVPWYGMINTVKSGSGYLSRNIFPVLSGNVSSIYMDSYGSTCTGNHDSSMYSSLYVLNNMNIGSMYFGEAVPPDIHDFVVACHKVSIGILKIYKEALNG